MKCPVCGKTAPLQKAYHISRQEPNLVRCYSVFVCKQHETYRIMTKVLPCTDRCRKKVKR